MRYRITERTVNITESTTITPEKNYGGWFAVNQGVNSAFVNGYELQPGEGIDMRNACPPGCVWGANIKIVINTGAEVRLSRFEATPIG